jgi:hypothetical protein
VHKRFGFVIVLPAFVLSAGTLSAQAWELKDSGVGLVVQDADYDKQLKIARRGDSWDLEDLDEKGALANKYDGNQGFAVVGISIGGGTSGSGKVEWFIVNRDTNEVRLVATNVFTTTWQARWRPCRTKRPSGDGWHGRGPIVPRQYLQFLQKQPSAFFLITVHESPGCVVSTLPV